jgi:hypothetical protein
MAVTGRPYHRRRLIESTHSDSRACSREGNRAAAALLRTTLLNTVRRRVRRYQSSTCVALSSTKQAAVAIGEDHQVIAVLALFGNGSSYPRTRVPIDGAHKAHAALRAIVDQQPTGDDLEEVACSGVAMVNIATVQAYCRDVRLGRATTWRFHGRSRQLRFQASSDMQGTSPHGVGIVARPNRQKLAQALRAARVGQHCGKLALHTFEFRCDPNRMGELRSSGSVRDEGVTSSSTRTNYA